MKATLTRLMLVVVAAMVAWLALAGAAATKAPILQPDKLVILSTTDVKGKTSPCG